MNVALITTWKERCGIAEYADALVSNAKSVTFAPLDCSKTFWTVPENMKSFQIIHINYEPGLFSYLSAADIRRLRSAGKKVVLTLHTTHEGNNQNDLTQACDAVVVHERTKDSGFVHIPMGIDEVQLPHTKPMYDVATAGFPFPWKGFTLLAQATKILGRSFYAVCPESRHADANAVKKEIEAYNSNSVIETKYMARKQVISQLGLASVTAFCYQGGNLGISGAVRLGIAAKRKLVVTQCRQFRDLLESYADELYVVISQNPTIDQVAQVLELALNDPNPKYPNRMISDMGWSKVAAKYVQLYNELLGENV